MQRFTKFRWSELGGLVAAALLLSACSDPKSAKGFRLPDGDVDAGRATFVRLECTRCHTVDGESFAVPTGVDAMHVPLGGKVARVTTYGQLVTSIIHPRHGMSPAYAQKYVDADGKSLMPDFNSTMTVREMIDLVSFLHPRYELEVPDPIAYPVM